MKVAVFSDVHGNLIALDSFIEATRGCVDRYLCLGDVVNYGPWNDECLERVMELPGITVIEGNHERLFLGHEELEHKLAIVQTFFQHSRATFTQEDLIRDLPQRCDLGDFECRHTLEDRSIYPDTDIEISHNYLIGHSHHQYRIERSGFQIINPGSVGQNRKWIDRIDYLIHETETGGFELHSLPYDVERFLTELRNSGYPENCVAYYDDKPRKGGG
jgi:predicted phosphodiesterase